MPSLAIRSIGQILAKNAKSALKKIAERQSAVFILLFVNLGHYCDFIFSISLILSFAMVECHIGKKCELISTIFINFKRISMQERAELHKSIWKVANELRGSVDGWDFKAYVLITLFYRFISEDITNYINQWQREANSNAQDYSTLSDEVALKAKDELVKRKGYFILPSQLFSNVVKRIKTDRIFAEDELNIALKEIFKSIEKSSSGEASEENFKGLFSDFRFDSNSLGKTTSDKNKMIAKILNAIAELNFGDIKQSKIDLFGDAYEYLMRMYASSAGKSGGEYFTPQEVSRLLALLTSHNLKEVNKVYDPACGSGSLLLQVAKLYSKDGEISVGKGFFGQEKNITSYNLARMNMIIHHINYNKSFIAHGDTLLHPEEKHKANEPFDIIVSNPPYSTAWEGEDNATLMRDTRFTPAGALAPKSKSDLAFVMHILAWLSEKGVAAIVEFPGVLYRSGAEAKIRQYLIKNNFIDCVIQLPENLFFGVSIATCIIVLKKNKADSKTLFINASEFFIKATNKNKLSDENINEIVKLYAKRENVPHIAALVKNENILKDESVNLSVSSYVEAKDTRVKVDIKALNKELIDIVKRQESLRASIDEIVRDLEGE